jgi:hypothetical protein
LSNFLQDFFFGRPDPVTSQPTGGLAQSPFAKFWGGAISAGYQALPAPARLPAQAIGVGLQAIEATESYVLARPFSTTLQALNIANPLYRNGIQVDDFVRMWNASEYISPGRAGVTNIGTQLGIIQAAATGEVNQNWNEFSFTGDYNPYEMSPEELERRWDESPLGTVGSTSLDTAFVIIAGGKGVNAAASGMKRAAGLSTSIKSQKDLTKLRVEGESGILWKESGGTEGKRTPFYKDIEDIAKLTDVNEIYNSRLLNNWTRSGSFNRTELAEQWAKISDERLILDMALADRGDAAAIGRLFREAPDTAWSLSDMNEVMRRQFASGGQFVPDEQVARIYNQTFESAIERDEFWSSVKNTFMVTDPNSVRITAQPGTTIKMEQGGTQSGEVTGGLISGVRGPGSAAMPMGIGGAPVISDAVGYAERWIKRTMGNAAINRPNSWHEISIPGNSPKSPATRLLFWAGSRRPNNMIEFNQMRPDDIVSEMVSYSRSSRVLRRKQWTVTRNDADGIPVNVTMRDFEWRAEAIARISQAKSQGDQALARTVRDLETELISVVGNKYGISPTEVSKVSLGLRNKSDAFQAQVARDGFWIDHDGVRVVPDPVTRRQLPNSLVLMPLDDLDLALRKESSTRYARRGRGTRRTIEGVESALNSIYRFFRTNVLFTGKYVPKNSIAEPAVAAMLADASLLPEGGLLQVAGRVAENTSLRTLQLRYGITDVMPASAARRDRTRLDAVRDEYEAAVRELEEIDLRIDDLTSQSSPATQAKYLNIAQAERRAAYARLKDVEERMSINDPVWKSVDELPTYTQLKDRVQLIDDAFNDPDFVVRAQARIDEISASRTGGARDLTLSDEISSAQTRLDELQARRASLNEQKGKLAERGSALFAGRSDVPVGVKRKDLVDPDNIDARVAPDWIEQLARVNDPRKFKDRLRKSVPDAADRRRVEAIIRSIRYTDDQIAEQQRLLKNLEESRGSIRPLNEVDASEVAQLERLIAARAGTETSGNSIILGSYASGTEDVLSGPVTSSWINSTQDGMRSRAEQIRQSNPEWFADRPGTAARQSPDLRNGNFGDFYVLPEAQEAFFAKWMDDFYPNLSDNTSITLYRGGTAGDASGAAGQWWTLDPRVAEIYARGGWLGRDRSVEMGTGTGSVDITSFNVTWGELKKYLGSLGANPKRIIPETTNPLDSSPLTLLPEFAVTLDRSNIPKEWASRMSTRSADELKSSRKTDKKVNPQELLDDLRQQLEEVRAASFRVEPTAVERKKALEAKIAELDGRRRSLSESIATRNLSRERARQRKLSGEDDLTVRGPSGTEYRISGAFSDEPGQFGSALRADSSADLTAYQTATGGARAGTRWKNTDSGETINPFDSRYWDELAYVANRHVMGDDFATLFLQGKSQGEIIAWFRTPAGRNYRKQMGWTNDDLYGEGGVILRTQERINEYFPTPEVRARLLESGEVTPAELQKSMSNLSIDQLSPIYGTGLEFVGNLGAQVQRGLRNASDTIWRNLAAKPESRFGRWPFFQREYRRQMETQISLAEQQGLILTGSTLQAMQRTARSRALKEMENTFYNIRRITGPVYAMRYLVGFPAAAYNTAYRYGRLAYRSPGNANVQAQAWMNALTFLGVDEDGNEAKSYKDIDSIVVNVPEEWNIPIDSRIRIKAESLYLGAQEGSLLPTVTIPISTLMMYKPDLEDWMKKELPDLYDTMFDYGTGTSPDLMAGPIPLDPLLGSYQRKAIKRFAGMFEEIPDEDFARVTIQDFQYQLFQWKNDGENGPRPKWQDSAKNARDYYSIGTAVSFFLPGSYYIAPEGQYYREEWSRIREKHPNDWPAAQAEMIDLYGPGAWYMMRPTSINRAAMPPTAEGFQVFTENEDLLRAAREIDRDNPNNITQLMFLDSQDYDQDDFSRAVYDWQGRNSLPGESEPILSRMSPQQIDDEIQISRSWALYNAAVAKRDAMMMEYGYTQLRADGDSDWLYREWNQFYEGFINNEEHRLWRNEKNKRDEGRALRIIDGIDEFLDNRKWMSSYGSSITWKVISDYRTELDNARLMYDTAETPAERSDIAEQWDSYVRYWFLPQGGNFSNYYERYLSGRDINGKQLLERELDIPRYPILGGS